ncbi:MAG: 6-carboxytetrahydropterin synthase, partial [Armatimonadetes bacterium]|nr:6-carboxytetrahydropterin synthase [Armatimonadota bacterium]
EIVKEKILKKIDHTFLNDLLPQPTAENLAVWIWENLNLPNLYEIKLWENQESFVTYRGEK